MPPGLGSNVRRLRRAAGLTQQQAADLAGMSVAALRDLEQGRIATPRSATLRRLAEAFRLPAGEAELLIRRAQPGQFPAGDLWLQVLGPVTLQVHGAPVELGSHRQRLLLGVLALAPNDPVSQERLIEVIWGTRPPSNVADLLRSDASRLRRRLRNARPAEPSPAGIPPEAARPAAAAIGTAGAPTGTADAAAGTAGAAAAGPAAESAGAGPAGPELVTGGGTYQLLISGNQLDLLLFRQLSDQARRARQEGDPDRACRLLAEAMALWRDEPLADLEPLRSDPAVIALIRDWQSTVVDYARTALGLGRHGEVLPLLRQVVERDPLHEAANAQLLTALSAAGQPQAAVAVFDRFRHRLADQFGTDPGPELLRASQSAQRLPPRESLLSTVTVRRQLPVDLAEFTGRADELATLHDWLSAVRGGPAPTATPVVAITGPGGSGKTRLAVHFAHQLLAAGAYPDLRLYVELGAARAAPVLAALLTLLGVAYEQLPADLASRAAVYRDRLAGRHALVLLDNATDVSQVSPLLPAGGNNLVVITSRRPLALPGARVLPLSGLPTGDAVDLLARIAGPDRVVREPAAARRLAALCGHQPAALSLAARRLRARPGWDLADLVERLVRAPDRLRELAAGTDHLRALFDTSAQPLGPPERRLLRLLGSRPRVPVTAAAVAPAMELPVATVDNLLDRLADAQLAEALDAERFRLPRLVHEYARTLPHG